MRRPLASLALSLLLTASLVVPTIAADPTSSAGASSEPAATPSADPTPADPTPTPEPTPAADATPSAVPTPSESATPSPSADPAAPTPDPAPSPDPTPTAEASPAPDPSPTTKPKAQPTTSEPATDLQGRPIAAGRYIVILSGAADTAGVISRHGKRDGIKADRKFERVRAFAAKLDAGQRKALLADPSVVAVVPDEVIEVTGQMNPTGVSRVGARLSPAADIDTLDDNRVDADVAIVDTGVALHPDLNVVGGVNCSTSDRTKWQDGNGHGTHVAGTVAAIDNTIGVVGVAPGARVWAVRILNSDGYGLLSWYVCGLDWILAQRDPTDSTRPLIEAVNMSVAKTGSDDHRCGTVNDDVLHQAICRLYSGGITVVAAAANEHTTASQFVPAAYNEVITVSALADTDGKSGGLGGNRCFSWGTYDVDDTFADFSNYGGDVDIIAPGKCIWSTVPGPSYGYSSGTSMAAPAVTGGAALYKASRPLATPSEVRESLRYLGNLGWKTSTDPDSVHEPLLDVSRVDDLGTFSLGAATTTPSIPLAGGVVTVPVTVNRSPTFFERVNLSIQGLPSGWSATFGAASLFGWTAKSTTATITVPKTAVPGTYQLIVVGTNWGRTATSTINVPIEGMPFTDLAAFSTQIEWLYNAGITTGCSPTLFCPTGRVTRAQMALFLDRALELPDATIDYFDDDDGKTGEASINALAKSGITGGCGPRRFCPSAYVTRAQMAIFLDRALDLPNTTTNYFDDDKGKTGEASINALALSGITGGCGPRRYCPLSSVTREQLAAFLYRAHIQGRLD
jgi:subtilisin family serine protease